MQNTQCVSISFECSSSFINVIQCNKRHSLLKKILQCCITTNLHWRSLYLLDVFIYQFIQRCKILMSICSVDQDSCQSLKLCSLYTGSGSILGSKMRQQLSIKYNKYKAVHLKMYDLHCIFI